MIFNHKDGVDEFNFNCPACKFLSNIFLPETDIIKNFNVLNINYFDIL
jgi:hypothetical protein